MRARSRTVPQPVMFVIVILSILTLYQILQVSQQLKTAQGEISTGQADRQKLASAQNNSVEQTQALVKQVEQLGAKPVVNKADIPAKVQVTTGPAGPPGVAGQQGAQGPIGPIGPQGLPPSVAQVAQAVAAFCANDRCKGTTPTPAQIASAVSSYCAANGQCRGPAGSMGPAPTDLQIASSVSSYCAQESAPCRGVAGKDGKDGKDGLDGVGSQGEPGQDGQDGEDALPFKFQFTDKGLVTYQCTVTSHTELAVCEEVP